MEHKKFIRIFLALVFGGLFLSALLAVFRIGGGDNDLILRHQIAKMDRLVTNKEQLDFVVLGDSSAGHGLDSDVLARISGLRVENFALTGSFGVVGSLHMLRHLHERLGVRRFVLVHSPDIWHRALQKEAVFKLLDPGSLAEYQDLVEGNVYWEFFKYLLNPHRIVDTVQYAYEMAINLAQERRPYPRIESDFLAQSEETFASGAKSLQRAMEWRSLSHHKLRELQLVHDYCVENKLNCILMSGPVHESAYFDLQWQMSNTFGRLELYNDFFHVDMSLHAFTNEWMGGTIDYAQVSRRGLTSRVYWESMSQYLKH